MKLSIAKLFKQIVESMSTTGWFIDPNGKLIAITKTTHELWLQAHHKLSVEQAIDQGWIRIRKSHSSIGIDSKSFDNATLQKLQDFVSNAQLQKGWIVWHSSHPFPEDRHFQIDDLWNAKTVRDIDAAEEEYQDKLWK
jgi:hypothetical protein